MFHGAGYFSAVVTWLILMFEGWFRICEVLWFFLFYGVLLTSDVHECAILWLSLQTWSLSLDLGHVLNKRNLKVSLLT